MQAVEARNEAYDKLDLRKSQREVLDAILILRPCTVKEVADHLDKRVNQIVGRFSELRDQNVVIKEVGKKRIEGSNWTVWDTHETDSERRESIYARFRTLTDERDKLIADVTAPLSEESKELIRKELNKIDIQINQIKKL